MAPASTRTHGIATGYTVRCTWWGQLNTAPNDCAAQTADTLLETSRVHFAGLCVLWWLPLLAPYQVVSVVAGHILLDA